MKGFVDLPEALSEQLLQIADAHRGDFNPMAWFFNRPRSPQPIDEDLRVQGLAAYWAEARVSFAYWDQVPDLDWDAAFRQYLPRVRAAEDPRDYYRLLREFSSLLRDGHTHVLPPLWLAADEGAPKVRLYPVERQPVVVEGEDLPLGTVITEVDGISAAALVAERMEVEPGSTDHDRLNRVVSRLLDGPADSSMQVGVRLPDGRQVSLELHRGGPTPAPALVKRVELGGGRVLVRINSWQEAEVVSEFHQAFPDFKGVRCLVIDLRRNRGGNSANGDQVLARLIDQPAYGVTSQVPMYAGATRSWGLPRPMLTLAAEAVQPDDQRPRYTGAVAVLTGFNTYSASENFCTTFRNSGRGFLVGEPTGGSSGQPVLIDLPGGGVGVICAKRDTNPDGSTFIGVGIKPDVRVSPTIQGVAAGRDEVLDGALRALGFGRV